MAEDVFKKLVSHCKEYGFVFPSSEIYDGLGAVYDYGQNGVEMKNNIKKYWWDAMVKLNDNVVGIDSSIFMHPTIWKASGHVDAFNDPLIDNRDSKKRYRADVLIEEQIAKYDEKIEKEVAKARKKFGEAFDEAKFRETSARVMKAAERQGLPLRNFDAVVVNYLDGGMTVKNHRASLRERFRLMRHHYGLLPTLAMHAWFVLRSALKK